MKKTFQSFVFGCRVNEAERMKLDKQLVEAGFSVDLTSPSFLIINTCAITGKAEREAKQLVYQLKKQHPEAQIVITGCSATLWKKFKSESAKIADIVVPNDKKGELINLLQVPKSAVAAPLATAAVAGPASDKFRHSNRLLVKIQDGCQRFCSYCIVPYLRGLPQSERIENIVNYINSISPVPSEVVLSAINTEAFGTDTNESITGLIETVLSATSIPRVAFGSIHPWSLTSEFIEYYKKNLSKDERFMHFFHVPLQSGSQEILEKMKREYDVLNVIKQLATISKIQPYALIATDVIVGFLGETDELFEESYSLLEKSPINKFHVFRFSNRPHTAAFYLKTKLHEPTTQEKKERSDRLITLSHKKYQQFIEKQIGRSCFALVIAKHANGMKILLNNQVEGILYSKDYLPGAIVRVTIISAKGGLAICKES